MALGLERGAELLTAGERCVVQAMRGLSPAAALGWARLVDRVHATYPEDELPEELLPELESAGLVDRLVPWPTRAARATREHLAAGCRALGLPAVGSRAALAERLVGLRGWDPRLWLRIRHRRLVLRLRRWAALHAWPDPKAALLERLGHVVWPRYALTPGPGLWPHRRALLAWEQLAATADPAEQLAGLQSGRSVAPGRLDLTRHLVSAVFEHARERERGGELDEATRWYAALRPFTAAVLVRLARATERAGSPAEALALLAAGRPDPSLDPSAAVDISAAGRRLARQLRRGWAPDPPLVPAHSRDVALVAGDAVGPRPGWRVAGRDHGVEAAVVATLDALGRRAVHSEGTAWTTLFALLFAETWFLPIPGQLPVPHLDGPLDLGTPAFAARRAAPIAEVLGGIRAGEAAGRVAAADARWRGVRLRGAAWGLLDGPSLTALAGGLPPAGLAAVLELLLQKGWRAARGLPDLVVLPGPEVKVPGAFPSVLGPGVVLAELKGPGDVLRPDQRVWADRLVRAGFRAEWWRVRPLSPGSLRGGP